jgi:hypothetical protein
MMVRIVTVFFAIMAVALVSLIIYAATVSEPARDARLEHQLGLIHSARSIDDLRPLLEQIVRQQRNDYR